MIVDIDQPVTTLEEVGPKLAARMADGLGIRTLRDLLEHYPRRYQDAGEVLDLSEVVEGSAATLLGEVLAWSTRRVPQRGRRRTLDLAEGRVRQASGAVFTVSFFNQNWRSKQLAPGTVAAFSGTVKRFRDVLQLAGPEVQVLGRVGAGLDTETAAQRLEHQRLLAIYPAVEGLPSFRLSELIGSLLEQLAPLTDWLPASWLHRYDLVELDVAFRAIHLPEDLASSQTARRRLVFDELLALQLGSQWRRARLEAGTVGQDNGPVPRGLAERFLQALPFEPTAAQSRALDQIGQDLATGRPMHRLLQGDVGSGKTLVAVWAMLNAVDHGRQAVLMVPTEVLADQHQRTLAELLAPLGINVLDGIRLEILTSSSSVKQRRRILGDLLAGEVDLVVGTHALLEEGVRFADLGVVVIDEQHRFGVSQRVQLKDKASSAGHHELVLPDVLVMTATPIPRSLALTLYGDLDVTVLDELPPGRQPITTQLITPQEAERRDRLYAFVRERAGQGQGTYVVCPFVEESTALAGTSAIMEHRRLAQEVFPDLEVALLHGQMRPEEKEVAMSRFRSGEVQVLVATTVIEVGVDVSHATVMVIEDAERFGIGQLHQLRGRVGRGGGRSFCVLFAGWNSELTDDARDRLEAVASTTDGFELAETDLEIRGSGQLFGRRQSGLPDLKIAQLTRDLDVIATTRDRARQVITSDPDLSHPDHARLRSEVLRRYEGGPDAFSALETG